MSWGRSQAEAYFEALRSLLSEQSVELHGKLWDYGAKVRMKATWDGQDWEFANDWSVETLSPPADIATPVLREILARRKWRALLAGLTEGERRAFEFGPWLRHLAQTEFAGQLPKAIAGRSSWARWEQHASDLAQMRPEVRSAYVEAVIRAGGGKDDLPGAASWPFDHPESV